MSVHGGQKRYVSTLRIQLSARTSGGATHNIITHNKSQEIPPNFGKLVLFDIRHMRLIRCAFCCPVYAAPKISFFFFYLSLSLSPDLKRVFRCRRIELAWAVWETETWHLFTVHLNTFDLYICCYFWRPPIRVSPYNRWRWIEKCSGVYILMVQKIQPRKTFFFFFKTLWCVFWCIDIIWPAWRSTV